MKKINKITMFTAVAITVASVCTNGIMYAIDNPAEKEITGNNNRYYGEMPADNSNSNSRRISKGRGFLLLSGLSWWFRR